MPSSVHQHQSHCSQPPTLVLTSPPPAPKQLSTWGSSTSPCWSPPAMSTHFPPHLLSVRAINTSHNNSQTQATFSPDVIAVQTASKKPNKSCLCLSLVFSLLPVPHFETFLSRPRTVCKRTCVYFLCETRHPFMKTSRIPAPL